MVTVSKAADRSNNITYAHTNNNNLLRNKSTKLDKNITDMCSLTNYRIGPHRITSDCIELHRTMSDHVCKQEIIISKAKPKSTRITFRVNKPPGMQLAHYKLGRHKSSIRPRSSVAYMSPTVSKTVCS